MAEHEHHGFTVDGIISQSDVLEALRGHMAALGPVAAAPIGALFPLAAPHVLPAGCTMWHCFQQLHEHGYNGCALVGDDGAIVANVSLADVRGLAANAASEAVAVKRVDAPALSFLAPTGAAPRPPVTAAPTDSLGSVIELLCSAHVHRVHVVNAARVPIGVVTMMDVLRLLLSDHVTAHELAPSPAPVLEPAEALVTVLKAMTAGGFVASFGVPVERMVELEAHTRLPDALKVCQGGGGGVGWELGCARGWGGGVGLVGVGVGVVEGGVGLSRHYASG